MRILTESVSGLPRTNVAGLMPWRALVLIVILLLLGPGMQLRAAAQQAGTGAAVPTPAIRPILRELVEYDEYTGRFAAVNRVEVRARVSGYLSSVEFAEGQPVKAGDLLFVIDQRPFKIAVMAAQAELNEMVAGLELTKTEADRARTLRKSLAISQEDMDQRVQAQVVAAARLSQAEAALARAKLNLEFTEIRAPISGRIGRRRLDVGNMVIGGDVQSTLLATIVQEDPIHFYFEVSEADFLRYARLSQAGARPASRNSPNPISVKLLDEEAYVHHGVMDFVDNELNATTGTVIGRGLLPNSDGLLQPGLFGRVRLPGSGLHEVVLVPDAVIQFDQSRQFVYVINPEGIVERRWVTVGPIAEGFRIVREGLIGDELVVADAFHRIRTGALVAPRLDEAPTGNN